MKKFLLTLALLICASSVTLVADNLSHAKRDLKAAQKELSAATTKRNKAQLKQTQLQTDYKDALAKVEANKEKPKSLAYKDAVKKSESLSGKLEQNAAILLSLNRQVDSLTNVVVVREAALSSAQQTDIEEKHEERNAEPEQVVNDDEEITLKANLQPVDKSNNEEKATIKEQKPVAAMDEKSADDSESSLNPFWTWVIIIGMGILFIWCFWVSMKRSLRCPKCGRWFVYEKDGVKVLNKQRDRNGSGRSWIISYERRYRCSNCGHKRVEKGKRSQSTPDLPSEWY